MNPLILKNKAIKSLQEQEKLTANIKSLQQETQRIKQEAEQIIEQKTTQIEELVNEAKDIIQEAKKAQPKIEEKLNSLSDEMVSVLAEIKHKSLKGDKGDPGESVDEQALENRLLAKIPRLEQIVEKLPKEDKIVKKVLAQIPNNKPSLKVIQESIDINAVADKVKKELSIEDIKDWRDKWSNIRAEISRSKASYYQVAGAGGGTTSGGSPLANEFNYIISKSGSNTVAYDVANSTILSTSAEAYVAIQAAVDAAYNAGGGLIGIKAGTYVINNYIRCKSNVHIKGSGRQSTMIQCPTRGGYAFGHFGTDILSNFTLEDMTIDCQHVAGVSGFAGEYVENSQFRNLEILNIGLPNVVQTAGSFEIGRSYNIASIGTTDFTLIGAASNTVGLRFNPTGPGTGTGTAQLIDNNTGFGIQIGIYALPPYSSTVVNRNIKIDNCRFDGFCSTNEEFLILNAENIQVTDCEFGTNSTGQGPGIGIFQWVENIEVTGCTFSDINGPSIYYSLSCNQIDIHDNFFLGIQTAIMGAALSDSDKSPHEFNVHKVTGLRVTSNYFHGNTTGVQLGSTDGAIVENNIFQELINMPILINFGTEVYTLALGTRTLATNFKIVNNVFIDNNQEAIDFFANAGILFAEADGNFYGEISGNTFYDTNDGTVVTAGSFIVGHRYTINTLGTTDFTLIGAPFNIVGVTFTATGAGTGTGTAIITTQRTCITFQGYNLTPAGAFKIGSIYGILPTGFPPSSSDTDFTAIGAANNNNGTVFTATGIGSGVGNAMEGLGSVGAAGVVAGTYYAIMTIGTTDWTLAGASNKYTAGNFTIGRMYEIFTIGTTDFTLIGAASNTVGLTFTATGVGSGTGTAVTIGDIFKATGATVGTGTALIVKQLNFNNLVIKDNRLQSNGTLVDQPIQLLNGAVLGQNVVYENNWNVDPNNFYAHGNTTGTVAVSRKDGAIQQYVLTGNINISIADGIFNGDQLTIMLKQDSTGGRTATWGGTNISWATGSAPILNKTASLTETFDFVWDSANSKWVEIGNSTAPNLVTTVAGLPVATTAGIRGFVSDSNVVAAGNFGAVVVGGGANKVPVYADGAAWRIG
jgi:hypothetical protein